MVQMLSSVWQDRTFPRHWFTLGRSHGTIGYRNRCGLHRKQSKPKRCPIQTHTKSLSTDIHTKRRRPVSIVDGSGMAHTKSPPCRIQFYRLVPALLAVPHRCIHSMKSYTHSMSVLPQYLLHQEISLLREPGKPWRVCKPWQICP